MASNRRIGAPDAKTRALLLDAAEQLMLEEGYAAVTSRQVGKKAGITPQLVHYYFRTMDDLFLEMFRRRAEERLERFANALAANRSLRGVWELSTDPRMATFNIELTALANHRKVIRTEIARYAKRFRDMQLHAIQDVLAERKIPPEEMPPIVLLLAMTGISQIMALEKTLGVSVGHRETVAFIERSLDEFEARHASDR